QMTEQTNRYNAALDLARAVIMGDGKRAEAVGALVEQHGLTEEKAHQFVTAAQNGYLRQIQIRNPEA
ncbi:hypothetical protein, partial [Tropicimonas sp. IMCC6043]|uniref:hypothetical protein n=1 Tax=Tropicimonas sp. IMCC6043 TaxID=2510645 RepID=UPI0013EAEB69